jgi:hypothetical protein
MPLDWESEVYKLVHEVAMSNDYFTMDNVWELADRDGLPMPKEPRKLGPVMMRAQDAGICAITDDFKRSIMIERNHSRSMRIWRSLISTGRRPSKVLDFF